jgi:hypothetical protein
MVYEPDHANAGLFATRALRGRGTTMVLRADDRAPRAFVRLWDAVLGDRPVLRVRGAARLARRIGGAEGREARFAVWRDASAVPTPRMRVALALSQPPHVPPAEHVVVKTVASVLAVEWLLARYAPRAVWVRRHPLDVVAGRTALGMTIDLERVERALFDLDARPSWTPLVPDEPIGRAAWYVGFTMSWCADVVARRTDVVVVDHEDLCTSPRARFRTLAGALGLDWTAAADEVLRESDTPGTGWSTRRVTAEQPGRWQTRLSEDEQRVAIACLRRFPIAQEYADLA